MCSQAKGEKCCSSSSGISKPAVFSVATACSTYTVFQYTMAATTIQATGTQPLIIIEHAIVDHSAAVEAHRAAQRVFGFTAVQADRDAAAEFGALQPFEHEQRALGAAEFARAPRQTVLAWVRSQLA
jgi:hypothetical protein